LLFTESRRLAPHDIEYRSEREGETMKTFISTALVLVAIAGFTGACASSRTAGEQIDDATISTEVKAKLAGDPDVKAFGIDVDTVDGIVSLRGNVDTGSQRAETERIARSVRGVRGVKNELSVKSPETIGTHIDDAGITAAVKTAFATDPDVKALSIDVDTRDGVVTLSGRVGSAAERARAEDIARRTNGVKAVHNELTVGNS
jgi:hyperosmotically inducible protein